MAIEKFGPIKLSPEMKKDLQDMRANLEVLKLEIAKAKRAALPGVEDLEKRFNEMSKIRSGILKEYS